MLVDSGRSHISLTWAKPSTTLNAAPVLAYKVDAWLVGPDGGARWTELGMTPINSYDAFNLRPGNYYHFRVTSRNRYGWGKSVQTTIPILVGGADCLPEFVKILPCQIKTLLGAELSIDCVVRGSPRPKIVWYRDGTQLQLDDRVLVSEQNAVCNLRIRGVRFDDSGRYTCEAMNTQGRVMTFARLQVVSDPKIAQADLNLKRLMQDDVVGGIIMRNKNRFADATTQSHCSQGSVGEVPPQLIMRLRDRRVQVGHPVRLTCQAVGWPMPTITWFRDDVQLVQDGKHV